MDQLEMFRRQLRSKPEENAKKKRMKKKGEVLQSVKVPASTLRDARVLCIWLEDKGLEHPTLANLFAEALDLYINQKYPEAREGVKMGKKDL